MVQFVLTVAAAKRMIGKALAAHPTIKAALFSATLVIIGGTPTATPQKRKNNAMMDR
jgi:hypothetical protein